MKITLEYSMKLNPRLNPDLFIPDPKIVLEKINKPPINEWLKFIADEYEIQKVKNLILIPCSFYKPYDPPHDEFYRRINELRRKVRDTKFITVSVPLALEPEEFWGFGWRGHNLIYDCPFFPWIKNFGYEWNEEIEKKVYAKLSSVINMFFERNRENFEKAYAFFVSNSFEARLIKDHVDHFILNEDPKIEVSYDNNTSEVYCHPKVWKKFEEFLKGNGIC